MRVAISFSFSLRLGNRRMTIRTGGVHRDPLTRTLFLLRVHSALSGGMKIPQSNTSHPELADLSTWRSAHSLRNSVPLLRTLTCANIFENRWATEHLWQHRSAMSELSMYPFSNDVLGLFAQLSVHVDQRHYRCCYQHWLVTTGLPFTLQGPQRQGTRRSGT